LEIQSEHPAMLKCSPEKPKSDTRLGGFRFIREDC
jgi:hypothetical protein